MSRSLGSVSVPRTFDNTSVSNGGATIARIQASNCRRRDTARARGRRRLRSVVATPASAAVSPSPAGKLTASWPPESATAAAGFPGSSFDEITWMSIDPDARMTLVITEPRMKCVHRD